MKKITITLIALMLIAPLLSITVETIDGTTIKGLFIKKVSDRYTFKTMTGSFVVFEEEIQRVISDTGTDITVSFIAMEPEPEEPQLEVNHVALSNIKVISAPLWVLTLSTAAYYIYNVFNIERDRRHAKKLQQDLEYLLP